MLKKRRQAAKTVKTPRRNARHFRDEAFLKALGEHCRRLRIQKGYSIDRLAKEGEQLSPSVIHRLENGLGAVTVSALWRFSQVLGLPIERLFEFDYVPGGDAPKAAAPAPRASRPMKLLSQDDPSAEKEAFRSLLPLYSARAAAGYFGRGETVQAEGWIEVNTPGERRLKLDPKMFVVRARGNSMLPKIRDGDYLVFRADPSGSRQGKIVLAQYRGPADPDTGGSYTVKQYFSSKMASEEGEWRHRQITLQPLNPEYEPLIVLPKDESDFRIVAEYVTTV